jgi:hypothetical protein
MEQQHHPDATTPPRGGGVQQQQQQQPQPKRFTRFFIGRCFGCVAVTVLVPSPSLGALCCEHCVLLF